MESRRKQRNLETRAGLVPSQNEGLPYAIRTNEAERHLQEKFDVLANSLTNEQGGGKKIQWHIDLFTNEASKKFLPFVMVIPDSALADSKQDKDDYDEEEIFRPHARNHTVKIQRPFYELLKIFMYDKNDVDTFKKSNAWKIANDITRSAQQNLVSIATPKIVSFNNGHTKKTLVLIDPLRVFHDMLTSTNPEDDKRDFKVNIDHWKKIDIGEYEYTVIRYLAKKGNYKKSFKQEFNAKMRSGR